MSVMEEFASWESSYKAGFYGKAGMEFRTNTWNLH